MIKKVIGIVVAVAAIVVIALAALHNGDFKSLVFEPAAPTVEMPDTLLVPDSLRVDTNMPVADSRGVNNMRAESLPDSLSVQ